MKRFLFFHFPKKIAGWLEKRREAELERLQARLNQAQWQNSLAEKTHDADLSAGYNLSHFNTMQ